MHLRCNRPAAGPGAGCEVSMTGATLLCGGAAFTTTACVSSSMHVFFCSCTLLELAAPAGHAFICMFLSLHSDRQLSCALQEGEGQLLLWFR